MKKDALDIISCAIRAADPYDSTKNILNELEKEVSGKLTVFSIGKAAVPMASAAQDVFGDEIKRAGADAAYSHGHFVAQAVAEYVAACEQQQYQIGCKEAVEINFHRAHLSLSHQNFGTKKRCAPGSHGQKRANMRERNDIFAFGLCFQHRVSI